MLTLAGVAFAVVGAVFAAGLVRPNGFCGVRLPWTLGDEVVWDRVNRRGGELMMMWGGLLVALGSCDSRSGLVALVVPGVVLAVLVTLAAALEYRARHGTLEVTLASPGEGDEPPSALADLALLAIPLVGLYATWSVLPGLPAQIPVHFDLAGAPDGWGPPATLLRLQYVTLVLWAVLAVAVRWHRGGTPVARRALLALRAGALLTLEAVALAAASSATGLPGNLWVTMGLPLGLVVAGVALLLREAIAARPW